MKKLILLLILLPTLVYAGPPLVPQTSTDLDDMPSTPCSGDTPYLSGNGTAYSCGAGGSGATIDDTKSNGDTTYVWSADKVYDQLQLKANVASPSFTGNIAQNGTLGNDSIVNGTFAADTDWTKGAGWTIAGGKAIATATTGNLNETATTVVAGKYYELTWDVVVTSGTYRITAGGNTTATYTETATGIEWYFYATTTGAVTFDGATAFTGTIDNVTLKEVSATTDLNHTAIVSSTITQPVIIKSLLNDAQGDQAAMHLVYETNKTAGSDTGLLIDMLDTASPGTSYLVNLRVGGLSRFNVTNLGSITATAVPNFSSGINSGPINAWAGTGSTLNIRPTSVTTADIFGLTMSSGTYSATSGSGGAVRITPTYNQDSGTAANTDLLINRIETALGSGTQRLISAGTGGGTYVPKFEVSNNGMHWSIPPAAQTIATGNTIAADGCGTIKQITAAGAVTTDTTNTFTAPESTTSGCCMDVVNVGAAIITLDDNANFLAGADQALTANDAVRVCSNGTAWYLISARLTP